MTCHRGSCHCGAITVELRDDPVEASECNCSMCRRRGSLLWFVPRAALQLTTPETNLSTYQFHKHVIDHRFCANCGIHVFGEGTSRDGQRLAAVNVRCVEGVDLQALPVQQHDGLAA